MPCLIGGRTPAGGTVPVHRHDGDDVTVVDESFPSKGVETARCAQVVK
jgi:hypothetical protein